jgi:hypothetical protein
MALSPWRRWSQNFGDKIHCTRCRNTTYSFAPWRKNRGFTVFQNFCSSLFYQKALNSKTNALSNDMNDKEIESNHKSKLYNPKISKLNGTSFKVLREKLQNRFLFFC